MTARAMALALLAAATAGAQQPAGQKAAPAATQKAAPVVTQKAAPATAQKAAPPAATQKAAPAPATKQAAAQDTKQPQTTKAPARPGLAVAPESASRPRVPVIMREVFTYDAEGRRDPFVTLLTSEELRPTVADLRLVVVILDPRRPVAVMRDIGTNVQYRVTTGMRIGRMRVAQIKRRTVLFSIEEFGLNRLDSLVLGDTTKARAK